MVSGTVLFGFQAFQQFQAFQAFQAFQEIAARFQSVSRDFKR